ncbi:MAG TPA: hypothetical protein VGE74_26255, partial [Gemmata sp.]
MGVPAELLGRQVRCPHCKQVVVAPTNVGPAPAPANLPPSPAVVNLPPIPAPAPVPVAPPPAPVAVAPPPPPPPPEPEPELRPFNIPAKTEGADSILSEPNESDDEVFGSHPGTRMPPLPPPDPKPQPEPAPQNPFSFGVSFPPTAPIAPAGGQVVPPFLTGTVIPLPGGSAPVPAPVPAPAPPPAATKELLDPFDDLQPAALAPPAPQPVPQP